MKNIYKVMSFREKENREQLLLMIQDTGEKKKEVIGWAVQNKQKEVGFFS